MTIDVAAATGVVRLVITQRKSAIGEKPKTRATLRSLGLRGVGSTRTHVSTPALVGALNRIPHLVEVREVLGSAVPTAPRLNRENVGLKYLLAKGDEGRIELVSGGQLVRIEDRTDGLAVGWKPTGSIGASVRSLYLAGEPGDEFRAVKHDRRLAQSPWSGFVPTWLLESPKAIRVARLDGESHSFIWERLTDEDRNGEFVALIDGSELHRLRRLMSTTAHPSAFDEVENLVNRGDR